MMNMNYCNLSTIFLVISGNKTFGINPAIYHGFIIYLEKKS